MPLKEACSSPQNYVKKRIKSTIKKVKTDKKRICIRKVKYIGDTFPLMFTSSLALLEVIVGIHMHKR